LLDWDALVARQSPEVAAILRRNFSETANALPSTATGQNLYQALARQSAPLTLARNNPGALRAANTLRDAGIPGLQYLDAGSRAAGQGTRNYVVFPGQDELIQIMRRYGILGPTVVGTGAALLNQQDQQ
jgi:hypothetical protein